MTTDVDQNSQDQQAHHPTPKAHGGNNENRRNDRPHGSGQGQSKNRHLQGAISQAETDEIVNVVQRVPGLGRMMLSLVRNRAARVVVPETAIGKEMFEIVGELDRVMSRASSQLTRNLNPEKMALKNTLEMRAINYIDPLAGLTAELAVEFDNPNNSILRHSATKKKLNALKAAAKEKKAAAAGAPLTMNAPVPVAPEAVTVE